MLVNSKWSWGDHKHVTDDLLLYTVSAYGQCQTRIGDYVSTEISPWGQFYGGQLRGCKSLV